MGNLFVYDILFSEISLSNKGITCGQFNVHSETELIVMIHTKILKLVFQKYIPAIKGKIKRVFEIVSF